MMDRNTWIEQIRLALEELGDREFQARVWGGIGPEVSSFTEAVCALQDKDLAGFIDRCVGWGFDVDLPDRLRKYHAALLAFSRSTEAYPDDRIMGAPRWAGLCAEARALAEELRGFRP